MKAAGADTCDMIIAVTYSDEINMVICQIAHTLFSVPFKIARVRDQSYIDPAWKNIFSNTFEVMGLFKDMESVNT